MTARTLLVAYDSPARGLLLSLSSTCWMKAALKVASRSPWERLAEGGRLPFSLVPPCQKRVRIGEAALCCQRNVDERMFGELAAVSRVIACTRAASGCIM